MLKGKTGKLEPRIEVCLFVGYPKGTRGGLFYSPQDKKVFASSNATFFEVCSTVLKIRKYLYRRMLPFLKMTTWKTSNLEVGLY